MSDSLYHLQSVDVPAFAASKGKYKPMRFGLHHYASCPFGVFKSAEIYFFILALNRQWPNVAKPLGKPELIKDPRFTTSKARGKNQTELIAMIEKWLHDFPTDEAALKALADHRVPAGRACALDRRNSRTPVLCGPQHGTSGSGSNTRGGNHPGVPV